MNDTPIILGADGNPIERELPTVTAIFAELMLGHPGDKGLTVDPERRARLSRRSASSR